MTRCPEILSVTVITIARSFKESKNIYKTDLKFVSGSCPLCEKDLTIGMKSIIRNIKISNTRATNSTDEFVSSANLFFMSLFWSEIKYCMTPHVSSRSDRRLLLILRRNRMKFSIFFDVIGVWNIRLL